MRTLTSTGRFRERSSRLVVIIALLLTSVFAPSSASASLPRSTSESIAPRAVAARQGQDNPEPTATSSREAQEHALYLPSLHMDALTAMPAQDRYVNGIRGSDSNPGSADRPWKTIQKAADTMGAGGTVHVLSGNYAERVQVRISGASGAPITFQAEGSVTMKGFTIVANYINVKGFYITGTANSWRDGVGIFLQGSNGTLENNHVYFATNGGIVLYAEKANPTTTSNNVVRNNRLERNSQYGIDVSGRNNLIEGNEIWRTIQYHPGWVNPPSWVDANGIHFFGAGHTIRKNYIHDIRYADPENVDPHIDCFQTWDSANSEVGRNIVFEQNYCRNLEVQSGYENGGGFIIEGGATNLVIRNNIIQAFRMLGAFDSPHITIVNNTFISSLAFTQYSPFGISLTRSPNAVVENNVFYDIGTGVQPYLYLDAASRMGLSVGYNSVARSDGETPGGSPYPHDLWGVNPRFAAPASNDFHLRPDSPVIDAGNNMGSLVSADFDGVSRPQRTGFDIGAFESAAP